MDICSCKYETDDLDAENPLDVLMTKMLMNFEVSDGIFPPL